MTAFVEELTEQELEGESGRNTRTANWASLVEARRPRAYSDLREREETKDSWSTTSEDVR